LKDDSEAEALDDELFNGKDSVLDKLIANSNDGKDPKILELDLTETFHREEEEQYLTAEEIRIANDEAEQEKKLREEGKYVEYRTAEQMMLARNLFPEMYPAQNANARLDLPPLKSAEVRPPDADGWSDQDAMGDVA
jgi:hypothetical protein